MRHLNQCFAVVWILAIINHVESRVKLKLTSLDCQVIDRDYLNVSLCELKTTKRDVAEISVYVSLHQKPVTNISVHITLQKRGAEDEVAIYENTADVCEFLQSKIGHPFIKLLYKLGGFTTYTNVNHTCPYDHDLIMEKYHFDERYTNLLPLRKGSFMLILNVFTYNRPRVDFQLQFEVFEK